MIVIRAVLLLAGLGALAYGLDLFTGFRTADVVSVGLWFCAGILLHDAVFAPLAAAVGLAGRVGLPARWWPLAATGAVGTVTLVLIAAPVLDRAHAHPDNPTVLDRNYPLGLALAVLLLWTVVIAIGCLRNIRTTKRFHTVVRGRRPARRS
ncbi:MULTISPECIES: hypothetical protein [unclassified Nocardia]|uniref:hypothetical protein n=1 Tax=unclassified Nocardia TaxID=2637762 RepID=UPI001CE49D85|nr:MULTISPECIES: hypothetical protein [unclassified Nocardia]